MRARKIQESMVLYKGYRIFVDIRTGKKLSPIQVANIDIIYWSFSSRGWEWGKRCGSLFKPATSFTS